MIGMVYCIHLVGIIQVTEYKYLYVVPGCHAGLSFPHSSFLEVDKYIYIFKPWFKINMRIVRSISIEVWLRFSSSLCLQISK